MKERLCPAWALFFVLMLTGAIASQEPRPTDPGTPEPHAGAQVPGVNRTPDYQDLAWRVLWLGLRHPKANQRVEAVKALSLMQGNRRAAAFAMRALNDPDPKVRAAAAATLGDLHVTAAASALRALLSDKEPAVMLSAT